MGLQILTLEMSATEEPAVSMLGRRHVLLLAPGPEIRPVRDVDDEEWADYSLCLGLISSLQMAGRLLDASSHNFDELEEAFDAFHFTSDQAGEEAVRLFFDDLINRRLSNYLSAMRLFLDHVEYRIKRTYGHDSEQAAALKARCSELFDSHFPYRFAYKLRNYTQHFGAPVKCVSLICSAPDPATNELVYTATAHFNLPTLLTVGRDCWGPVRKDLRALPPLLEVRSTMRRVPALLDQVWCTFLEVQRSHVEGALMLIEQTLAVEEPVDGYAVVGEWCAEDDLLALRYFDPPTRAIEWIDAQI